MALLISFTARRSVPGPWRKRQLRPRISSLLYLVVDAHRTVEAGGGRSAPDRGVTKQEERLSGPCAGTRSGKFFLRHAHPVNSMKVSEAKTSGQSGSVGSAMTKLCWMRSRVVAISRPARDVMGTLSLPPFGATFCAARAGIRRGTTGRIRTGAGRRHSNREHAVGRFRAFLFDQTTHSCRSLKHRRQRRRKRISLRRRPR